MATSAPRLPAADPRAAPRHPIPFVLSASGTFTLGFGLVKAPAADFPVLEGVMFRTSHEAIGARWCSRRA